MIWEMRVTVTAPWAAAVEEWLLAAESMGVSEDGVGRGEERQVRGYFDEEREREELTAALVGFLDEIGAPAVATAWTPLADRDWQEAWKEHIQPIPVGRRLLVLPTWRQAPEPAPELILRMDPEMAFGSGSHETTHGCLEALAAMADAAPLGRVLDLGTGSGILAIGALLLGAASVLATDNDPVAVATCRKNAALNGVAAGLRAEEREDVPPGPFETVVANILAPVLLELSPGITRALAPGGRLVLAGLLTREAAEVTAAYQAAGLREMTAIERGEWTILTGRKP